MKLLPPGARDARVIWLLAAGVALSYLAFSPPGIIGADGISMLAVAESIVRDHAFTVPAAIGKPGLHGLFYSDHYPLLSCLAVPLVAAGDVAARLAGLPAHYVAGALAPLLNALLTAATVGLVALLALDLGASLEAALVAALAYAFGTIAATYARTFFAEPLLACLVAAALHLGFRGSGRAVAAAAVLCGLAVLAKPTGAVLVLVLAGYLWSRRAGAAAVAAPLAGAAAGATVYALYNVVRFGTPFSTGFVHLGQAGGLAGVTGFALPGSPLRLFGLLASPGRGLLWYAPVAVLGLVPLAAPRRAPKKREAWALGAFFLAFLLVHALWRYWDGGWSWGPRFLLPAMPGLLALAALAQRRWLVGLAALGLAVNAPTLVAFYERTFAEAAVARVPEADQVWMPGDAPVVNMWPAAVREARDAAASDVRALVRRAGAPGGTVASGEWLRTVAVWWWMLPAARLPRWPGIALSAAMVGAGLWLVVLCLRAARRQPAAPAPGPPARARPA